MILALDTSLPLLSVALVDNGKVIGALQLHSEGSRNERLLPAIDWILGESGIALADVQAIAVTRGPGSFTGVRIGLATVQGMSMAHGTRVCAMVTHHAIAFAYATSRLLVHTDGGRGEFYVAGYDQTRPRLEPCLLTADELTAASAEYEQVVDLTASSHRYNVAMWTAFGAERIIHDGSVDQYADLTPVYVRLAEAEVKLREKQG